MQAVLAGLAGLVVVVGTLTVPTATQAAPPPTPSGPTRLDLAPGPALDRVLDRALGLGLGRLLQPQSQSQAGPARRAASGFTFDQESLTIRDPQGRVLVDLTPRAGADRAVFRRAAEAAGLRVQSTEAAHGTLEGFVALGDVRALAASADVGSLAQAVRPRASVGAATSQGVALQRADAVRRSGLDGAGVTVAALSDSYDTATTTLAGAPLTTRAEQDVAGGDLPGEENPDHPVPVVVLDDSASGATLDEGRAMLQVVHDVAPGARLCFATAQTGEVAFAAHIRALADREGPCGADVIVDDLVYFDEPMFSDGLVSDAVDDVAAQGVHYLTSAGNQGSNQTWDAGVHLVPAAQALAGSNLDLTGVDPRLYDGGFQDVAPGPATAVAQDVVLGDAGGLVDLQWDDPLDLAGPRLGTPYLQTGGTLPGAEATATFTFTPTSAQLGTTVQFRADAVPSGRTDLVMRVTAPDGRVLVTSDTTTSPEVFATELDQSGGYRVDVSGYRSASGPFTLDVSPVAPSAVTTDLNVLFFDPQGRFLDAAADVNTRTGRPLELAPVAGLPEVQMVVTRSGTGPVGAHRLRAALFGEAELAGPVRPGDPGVFGHATARGATAVAAYDPFSPFLPEPFTAPGGTLTVSYDSAGRRLAKDRQRRTVPQIAGADGGNTTFFGVDTDADADDQPNFFGTSAAAPHVAGVAALVVQRERQRGRTLDPAALRTRLERSTSAHDLDPFRARGRVGVVLDATGAQSPETGRAAGSMTDPHFFTLRHRGRRVTRSVTLDGSTAGIVFDPRPYDVGVPRTEVGFPFTVGSTSGGLAASDVSVSYAGPTGTGQFRRLTLTFAEGLRRGQRLDFGVDRDQASLGTGPDGRADEGNGADALGGGVDLPSGTRSRSGLTVTVVPRSGRASVGRMANRLGLGRTRVDGRGLVDAVRATRR